MKNAEHALKNTEWAPPVQAETVKSMKHLSNHEDTTGNHGPWGDQGLPVSGFMSVQPTDFQPVDSGLRPPEAAERHL